MNISKGEKNMDENSKYNTLDNGNTDVQNKENEKAVRNGCFLFCSLLFLKRSILYDI